MSPSQKSQGLALFLTLAVFPGMGHLYLGRRGKGILFSFLFSGILVAVFARFMYVMFALANIRQVGRSPRWNPFQLMAETWQLDHKILIAFLLLLFVVYLLAALDLVWQPVGRKIKE